MKNKIVKRRVIKLAKVAMFGLLLAATASQAALINRGNGMLYDDVLDVTWLQDAGYSKTSGANNEMTWQDATNWVDALVFQNYDDWRMPTISPINTSTFDTGFSFDGSTDRGYNSNVSTNEMAYMFKNNLGNVSYFNTSGDPMQPGSESFKTSFIDGDTGALFTIDNMAKSYWTNIVDNPVVNAAWAYNFTVIAGSATIATGESQLLPTRSDVGVWAVRDGDSSVTLIPPVVSPVSTPATLGLFGLILTGMLLGRPRLMGSIKHLRK